MQIERFVYDIYNLLRLLGRLLIVFLSIPLIIRPIIIRFTRRNGTVH